MLIVYTLEIMQIWGFIWLGLMIPSVHSKFLSIGNIIWKNLKITYATDHEILNYKIPLRFKAVLFSLIKF